MPNSVFGDEMGGEGKSVCGERRVDSLTGRQKRQKTETGELKSRGVRNVEEKSSVGAFMSLLFLGCGPHNSLLVQISFLSI